MNIQKKINKVLRKKKVINNRFKYVILLLERLGLRRKRKIGFKALALFQSFFPEKEKPDLGKRIGVAIFLGGVAIACIHLDFYFRILSLAFVLSISILGLREFLSLVKKIKSTQPFEIPVYVFSFILVLGFYAHYLNSIRNKGVLLPPFLMFILKYCFPDFLFLSLWIFSFFITIAIIQIFFRPVTGAGANIALSFIAPIYTVFSFSHVFLYYSFHNPVYYLYLFLLIPIFADTGAYFTGKFMGRHKLGLEASPNKTVEGYVGAYGFGIGVAYLYNFIVGDYLNLSTYHLSALEILSISCIVVTLSILGDLFESVWKRDARIKNSGNLPGHGGVLDLMDAMYITIPLGFYYLSFRILMNWPM